MDHEAEVIHQQIEEKRTALADKIERLENKVVATVQDAKDTVTDTVDKVKETVANVKDTVTSTVENVKDSVADTYESVAGALKETFDVPHHVEQHPWAMFGGAVALGFLGGKLMSDGGNGRHGYARRPEWEGSGYTGYTPPAAAPRYDSGSSQQGEGLWEHAKHWAGGLSDFLAPEMDKVKDFALGSLAGVVKHMVASAGLAQFGPTVNNIIDSMSHRLGVTPVPFSGLTGNGSGSGTSAARDQTGSGAGI